MDESIFQPAVWSAMFGALAIKLLELAEVTKLPFDRRPDFKDIVYWVPFLVMPLIGGGLAYIISGIALNPLLAVNIGISAPLIFRKMAEINPIKSGSIDLEEDSRCALHSAP